MKQFIENIVFAAKEKKNYLFLALPLLFILIAIASFIAVFSKPAPQEEPVPVPTAVPTRVEPTEDSFITPEPTFDPETEAILRELDKGETTFAEEQAAIRRDHPWIEELPLDEKNYFVYFDVEIKAFVGKLYPQTSSSTPVETQVEQMKTEIAGKLDNMNIPWRSYVFNWEIQPE